MKIYKLLLVGFFLSYLLSDASSQFSGIIISKYTYLNNKGKDITNQMIKSGRTAGERFYINQTNYKSTNSHGFPTQLYNSENDSYYFFSEEGINRIQGSYQLPKECNFEDLTEKDTILGRICNKIVMTSENGSVTYSFDPTLTINVESYREHNFGNWNKWLEKTNGAMVLKSIRTEKGISIIAEAVKIIDKNFNVDEFDPETLFSF